MPNIKKKEEDKKRPYPISISDKERKVVTHVFGGLTAAFTEKVLSDKRVKEKLK